MNRLDQWPPVRKRAEFAPDAAHVNIDGSIMPRERSAQCPLRQLILAHRMPDVAQQDLEKVELRTSEL